MRGHKQNDRKEAHFRKLLSFWGSTLGVIQAVGHMVKHEQEMGKFLKVRKQTKEVGRLKTEMIKKEKREGVCQWDHNVEAQG